MSSVKMGVSINLILSDYVNGGVLATFSMNACCHEGRHSALAEPEFVCFPYVSDIIRAGYWSEYAKEADHHHS